MTVYFPIMALLFESGLIVCENGRIMNKADKKQQILALLQRSNQPLGISTLLEILGDAFKRRTVRRLLSELSERGEVIRTGRGPSTQYHIVNHDLYSIKSMPNDIEEKQQIYKLEEVFSKHSLKIVEAIRQPLFHRMPVSYNKKWFEAYIPNVTFYFSESQRQKMQYMGNRTNQKEVLPAGTYSRKILNRLLIDLSYNSSRLEGNTYSKLDTEKLLFEGIGQDEKLDQERVMLLNHKYAIEYLVRQVSQLSISMNTICTLHYLLSDGLLPVEQMGKVRHEAVRIGQSTYLPLEDNNRLEANLTEILSKAAQINDPFEQSLFLLIHIAYLQPFMDVNKRTSRLSANIPFIQANYVPLSFNELDKDDYISAMLAVYELNQIDPMADLFYFSYLRTCQAYDATVESVGFDPIRVKYRRQRRDIVTHVIRHNLSGAEIQHYIHKQSISNDLAIKKADQMAFIESVAQDLKHLSINTIGGLGISQVEFELWKSNTPISI